jgi:hypothetical protein
MVFNSTKQRMIRNREFIFNYKKDKGCLICGYNKIPQILHFHHRNKTEKNNGINVLMKTLKSLEVIKEEIKKCDLLCPNCHAEITFKSKKYTKV